VRVRADIYRGGLKAEQVHERFLQGRCTRPAIL